MMIRKTAFLVTGTLTGLVAVLSYNPPKLTNAIASGIETAQPIATDNSSNQSASANTPVQLNPKTTATASSTATKAESKASPTKEQAAVVTETTSQSPTPAQKQSSGSSGTFKGDTSQTRWGPVQVQITVADGKITDVTTLQYPNGDRRSMMISQQVIPWLQQEVLSAQSGSISSIGGATYTSNGFKNSLASALQKAGM